VLSRFGIRKSKFISLSSRGEALLIIIRSASRAMHAQELESQEYEMKKKLLYALAGCVLAYCGWTVLQAQNSSLTVPPGAAYLTTITDATTGAFSSRSVITLHADHSLTAIDSAQGGDRGGLGTQFSSQMGAWRTSPGAGVVGRTLDFSFPNAGIARVD